MDLFCHLESAARTYKTVKIQKILMTTTMMTAAARRKKKKQISYFQAMMRWRARRY